MSRSLHETIVAPITGNTKAAVAVIRLSGPDAWRIASEVFAPWPEAVRPRYALYGTFSTGDDGLALPFEEGKSYTGEQSVELNIHGSPASVRMLVEACIAAGARPAGPGEFTYRAFMAGRIDLSEAEGVRETIEAEATAQLTQANRLRSGGVREACQSIRDLAFRVLAAIEATVDFSEEIGELDHPWALDTIQSAITQIDQLLAGERWATLVREGLRIAIVGLPNAGKSSLLNAMLRTDRAIVTPIPGTTRDTLEETVEIHGYLVRLIDTAGLRSTSDTVESIGIDRAREAAENADLRWYVFDASAGWTPEDASERSALKAPTWILANKIDLPASASPFPTPEAENIFPISTRTQQGMEALLTALQAHLPDTAAWLPIQPRHAPILRRARESLLAAQHTLSQPIPVDLAAVQLRETTHLLGEITGETASEDMVDRIFRDFCIGK